jgi:FAD/FMN-containing dehydrogenase/Fe-S oxidoreductase
MTRVDAQQRGRIKDDLKGIVKGQLLFDDVTLSLYSTDASIFQVSPLGVVVPRDEEDVQGLVRYASEAGVPLIARGAGTGMAGEALGKGLILDLSQHFRQIVEVGSDTVRVQPGVTYRALNERLATLGRRFAPDPASGSVCTIGGMLANNASGSHALRYGYTRDHVEAIRVVLDSGDACTVGKESWPPANDAPTSHLLDILNALGVLLEQNGELIASQRPRTSFNRCGYLLHDVFNGTSIDLARLLVGSEGTLGLFTEATLRTVPVPEGRSLLLLSFASLDAALRAARKVLLAGPAACELMDRRLLSLARGSDASRVAQLVPAAAEAVLLVEFEGDNSPQVHAAARNLASVMMREEKQLLDAVPAFAGEDLDRLWQLREVALPSLYGLKGGAQPVPFVEDIGVPLEDMPEFIRRVQEILHEQETTASFLIHACTGQIHTRPFLDLQSPADVSKLTALAENIHALALGLGGTISSQHGTGLARTPWVARQFGPLYPILRQVKAIFDPKNIFNPGKIVDPEPGLAGWPLRTLAVGTKPQDSLHLSWQPEQVRLESNHCNGCGHCRTEATYQRMCPIFRATQGEAASPRAKANLLRDLLHEAGTGQQLASDQVRAVADLCVHCKMCHLECPAHINIPKLMLETKAANVTQHGLDRTRWFLSRLDTIARLGSFMGVLANRMLASFPLRWVLDKVFGLSSRRRLPLVAPRTFLRQAQQRGWTVRPRTGRPCVALFVDLFVNYFDPQQGEAAVLVLQHNGIDVFVPAGQRACGMASLVQGDVETTKELVEANLRVLVEVAREGMPIVCLEPTSALMFRQDILDLLDDGDARTVAKQVVEITAYLADLHQQGRLRTNFQALDMALGHHVPCHLKALGQAPMAPVLLSLIPGVRVHTIDVGCSGMAGTFGLQSKNYQTSVAAGRPMLEEVARPRVLFGSTECSSCRLQMEDVAHKRTLHPVQYLALAYGLLPEVAQRLQEPIRDLVL